MSYPGNPVDHNHLGNCAIVTLGSPGVIVMGSNGLQMNTMGTMDGAIIGDTTGPNAVNPSGTAGGIRLPEQNNFRRRRR